MTGTTSQSHGVMSFVTDRKITAKIAIVVGVGLSGLVLVGAAYTVGVTMQAAE